MGREEGRMRIKKMRKEYGKERGGKKMGRRMRGKEGRRTKREG